MKNKLKVLLSILITAVMLVNISLTSFAGVYFESGHPVSVFVGDTEEAYVGLLDIEEAELYKAESKSPDIVSVKPDLFTNSFGAFIEIKGIKSGKTDIYIINKESGKRVLTIDAYALDITTYNSTFEVYPTQEDMKAKTNAVTEVTEELFAKGKTFNVLKDRKLCFNKLTLYTDAAPVTSDPNPYNERLESREGKIVVAVSDITVNDVRKVVKNGNPVKNSYASKILKASYKKNTGAIELKSGSKSGDVKLWVVNVTSAKEIIGFTTVNVKVNPEVKSVRVYKRNTDTGDPEGPVIKEVILKVGEQKEFVVIGSTDTKGNVKADKAAYILGWKITPDFKSTVNNFLYSPINYHTYSTDDIVTDDIDICGVSTINGKVIKSTATLTCIQSGKKAKIKVNIVNPVEDITVTELTKNDDSSVTDTFCRKNDIAVFRITEDTPAARYAAIEGDDSVADTITTDKLKIYVAKPQDDKAGVEPFTVKNGKIVYEKSKAVNAKYDDGMLTLTRRDPDEAAEIWFAYTDPITKDIKTWKVVDVTANDYSSTGMGDAIAVTE